MHDTFSQSLMRNVNISSVQVDAHKSDNAGEWRSFSAMSTGDSKYSIRPEDLVKRWKCSIETAQQTIRATTQKGIRTVAHPSIARRFRTNDRQLRYNRLSADVFTDTMKAKTVSFRGNRYAQVFTSNFKWARSYGMKSRSEAHYALKTMFARDGYPTNIFCDNAMEQVGGDFRKTCREVGCHLKSSEP